MAPNEEPYIAELREHAAETRSLLSNPRKPERECMIARAYLRCLGTTFTDNEIVASTDEPVDVHFRAARFQIKEILGGRRRGKEWIERGERYHAVETVSDVIEPYTDSVAMPFGDVAKMVPDALARHAQHYGRLNCSTLDALVYIDLRNSHLWPIEPRNVAGVAAELDQQGWRSVSMLSVPYGAVLTANASAPDFLRSNTGMVLKAWHGPDG